MSDLDMLKEMGFDPDKAALAVQKGGNLQGAIDWLEKNQDKSIDDLNDAGNADEEEDGSPALAVGETAKSLLCKECGKKFRSQAQAEFHASKTEHVDFEESTEEIAPLTEEEKKAKLEELRQKLAEKRAGVSQQDLLDKKRNEEINRKNTKEAQDIKEELQKREQIKEADKKRQEKKADAEAKARIQAKIAADKEARKLKSEQEKAARSGSVVSPAIASPVTPTVQSSAPKTTTNYTEARLRISKPGDASITKTFPAEATLLEVAQAFTTETGITAATFATSYPKKIFYPDDFGTTLKDAGLVPSGALIVT